jgi:diacylglycerol kinase (ATP)
MRIFFLCNPSAGLARQLVGPDADDEAGALDGLRRLVGQYGEVTLATPDSVEATACSVGEALQGGHDVLVVAGGDGTIHGAINALAPDFDRCRLVLVPLGTGNDLCRTLGIPDTLPEAVALIGEGQEQRIDLIRVETPSRSWYAVNLASGGFSGQLQGSLTEEVKAAWGPLAYLRGAAGVLPEMTVYHADLECDGLPRRQLDVLNVIVANGRFAARGWRIASKANPEDGLLDVVVVRDAPVLDLAGVAARLVAGDYLDSENVLHFQTRRVSVRAEPVMGFSVDGELVSENPITFTAVPQALRVTVGADYRPAE